MWRTPLSKCVIHGPLKAIMVHGVTMMVDGPMNGQGKWTLPRQMMVFSGWDLPILLHNSPARAQPFTKTVTAASFMKCITWMPQKGLIRTIWQTQLPNTFTFLLIPTQQDCSQESQDASPRLKLSSTWIIMTGTLPLTEHTSLLVVLVMELQANSPKSFPLAIIQLPL